MGLCRKQSEADMPIACFLGEANEKRAKDERSLALSGGCFFCVRHESHGLRRSKPAKAPCHLGASKWEKICAAKRHFSLICYACIIKYLSLGKSKDYDF